MRGKSIPLRNNVVKFLAHEVCNESLDRAANDNCCPYCGGLLEPGDKASDCSGYEAWPLIPFPKGWGASC
jgi:hypothetical protein